MCKILQFLTDGVIACAKFEKEMVMFALSKLANMLHLYSPIGIILVYLGFGAGLSVFMFCGFVRSIPLEIEKAAMIDDVCPFRPISVWYSLF